MFLKYMGDPGETIPKRETTYWVNISNGGVDGEISVAIRYTMSNGVDNHLLWSCKYPDFESFTEDWEMV